MEWHHGEYWITTDKSQLDIAVIYQFLTTSYWAEGVPKEVVTRAIEHSLNFGLFGPPGQAGFARVITDYATFAYMADVFVLDEHRGQGLGKWLMEVVTGHPELQGLRRWSLATKDAHGLYRQYGFTPLNRPDRWMEKWDLEVYRRTPGAGQDAR